MKASSPFSELQQLFILGANAVFVLVALGNLLRSFHTGLRRGLPIRFTSAGLAILAVVVAVESAVIVYAPYLVPQHPTWFPVPPILALVTFYLCARIDDVRERSQAEAEVKKKQGGQSRLTEGSVVRLATWCARLLAISVATTLFSLYGELFGPDWTMILAVMGLLLTMAVFMVSRHPLGLRFLQFCPQGLSGHCPILAKFKHQIQRALAVVGACAFLSVALLFISAHAAGVPADGLPVFAPRKHYVLTNHGRRTEVSPVRFFAAAAGSQVGWHAGLLFATLLALHALLYGELPGSLKRRR
jgi:4-hydroxybenzoate polyprenyltransferase